MRSKEEFGLIVMKLPHMMFDELDTLVNATNNWQSYIPEKALCL